MSQSKTEPTVCCVMLTADRPELARRAVECFRRQTYSRARLCVFDTGETHALPPSRDFRIGVFHAPNQRGKAIGELRNLVASAVSRQNNPAPPDIFAHFDDDDWSHPNRIAEQVALLQSSGADCVGYREMLFWRQHDGEAWLYSNRDPRYCLGTSLCYWRKTWERKPFEATSQGEDERFTTGLKCFGSDLIFGREQPRMIARIHAGNTSNAYDPGVMRKSAEWKRVPEWDEHCRRVME